MSITLTPKRQTILEELKTSGLISARELAKNCADIDQATVYRNLDLFVAEGIAKRYHLDSVEAMYEYQEHAHHHGVCKDCGTIVHLDLPEEQIKGLVPTSRFSPHSIDITIYGKCTQCS